jgi:hypothetical protein
MKLTLLLPSSLLMMAVIVFAATKATIAAAQDRTYYLNKKKPRTDNVLSNVASFKERKPSQPPYCKQQTCGVG